MPYLSYGADVIRWSLNVSDILSCFVAYFFNGARPMQATCKNMKSNCNSVGQ